MSITGRRSLMPSARSHASFSASIAWGFPDLMMKGAILPLLLLWFRWFPKMFSLPIRPEMKVCGLAVIAAGPCWEDTHTGDLLSEGVFLASDWELNLWTLIPRFCLMGDIGSSHRTCYLPISDRNLGLLWGIALFLQQLSPPLSVTPLSSQLGRVLRTHFQPGTSWRCNSIQSVAQSTPFLHDVVVSLRMSVLASRDGLQDNSLQTNYPW